MQCVSLFYKSDVIFDKQPVHCGQGGGSAGLIRKLTANYKYPEQGSKLQKCASFFFFLEKNPQTNIVVPPK